MFAVRFLLSLGIYSLLYISSYQDKTEELKKLITDFKNGDNTAKDKILILYNGWVKEIKDSGKDIRPVESKILKIIKEHYNDSDKEGKALFDNIITSLNIAKWYPVKETILSKRTGYISAIVGDKFIVWGGGSDDGAVYNFNEDKWTQMNHSIISGRELGTGVIYNNKLIIWGGSYRNDGAIYDIEKDKWTRMKEAPIKGRLGHISILYKDKLLIWGGQGENGYYNDGAIYNIPKDEWNVMKKCPLSIRHLFSHGLTNCKLVIWGGLSAGKSGYEYCNDGAIYDIEKDSWSLIKSSPIDVNRSRSIITKDYIAVLHERIGKEHDVGAIYDLGKSTWTKISPSPMSTRVEYIFSVVGKKLVIWGGAVQSDTFTNDGWVYETDNDKWKKMKDCKLRGRLRAQVIVFDNSIIIWGGKGNRDAPYSDGGIYNLDKNSWFVIPEYPSLGNGEATLYGDKLLVWGGHFRPWDSHGDFKNVGAIYYLPLEWDFITH